MAFADPQSVTVAGTPHSLPRIDTGGGKTVYQKADQTWKLTLSHQIQGDKIRTLARLDQKIVVADPITAENDYETNTTYIVNERPLVGFSSTQVSDQLAGLFAWADATARGKLYGQET